MAVINDKSTMHGRLVFKVIRNGKVIQEAHDNLIVTNGRAALANLLGNNGTNKYIAQVGVGTGSTAAADGDTDLTSPTKVDIKETRIGSNLESEAGEPFEDSKIVQFHFVFGLTDAQGVAIHEYGLYCKDGTLFSRVVRATPFTKTSVDKIIGYWQITF